MFPDADPPTANGRPRVRRVAWALLLLAVIMPLLSSCSDQNDDAAASEPCRLMSAEEIKRYVNVPPEDEAVEFERRADLVSAVSVPGSRLCRFTHKSRAVAVDIGLSSSFPREEFDRWHENGVRMRDGTVAELERLRGLDQDAWRLGDVIIVPIDGNRALVVHVQMPDDETHQLERGRRLMRTLLKRI